MLYFQAWTKYLEDLSSEVVKMICSQVFWRDEMSWLYLHGEQLHAAGSVPTAPTGGVNYSETIIGARERPGTFDKWTNTIERDIWGLHRRRSS